MTDLTPQNLVAAVRAVYAQAVPDPVIGHPLHFHLDFWGSFVTT